MPKVTSGGASNAWEQPEAAPEAPVETPAAPAGPADPPAPAASETPAPVVEVPDVASMTKAQLQDHADSLGLPTDGTKADLATRITDHVETAASAATEVAS